MNDPYRASETKDEETDKPTTLERWWAMYKARRAMAAQEERPKRRTSTKLWSAAGAHGFAALSFWNVYMAWNPDSAHSHTANIISWNFAVLAWIAAVFTIFFLVAGAHMRWENHD